jgi:asparagine synthase (glutamine-hydrolysing)
LAILVALVTRLDRLRINVLPDNTYHIELEGHSGMGAIVAVKHKKDEDATEAALRMLNALTAEGIEAFGIASSSTIEIKRSFQQLQNRKVGGSTVVGYAFSKILKQDKPQPLKSNDAAVAFDGRVFPNGNRSSDAEFFAHKLLGEKEENAKAFIKRVDGNFAFVIAEPERLVAGRDPLGLNPLYFGENDVFVGLASQQKALWNIGIRDTHSFPPGHVGIADGRRFKLCLAKRLIFSKPKKTTMKDAAEKLQALLEQAVRERLVGLSDVTVAFSGGLDSSIIAFLCKKVGVDVQLIHVSLKEQAETEHAKITAEELKLPIHIFTYAESEVFEVLPLVLQAIEEPDPVKASIGIPIYWAAEKSAEMNRRVMFAGQGSDELFAGYKRYVDDYLREGSDQAQKAIFKDIIGIHESNFERDSKICNFLGVEMRLPFATYEIVKFAINLPVELKIEPSDHTLRKLVVRQTARNFGLSEATVDRPKKAMQYGTGVNDALNRLAKRKHLTLKEYVHKTFQDALKRIMQNA